MLTAICANNPDIGQHAVGHDVHALPEVGNTIAVRCNLRINGVFKIEHVELGKMPVASHRKHRIAAQQQH